MWNIDKNIEEISICNDIKIAKMNNDEKVRLFKNIEEKYLVGNLKFPLWERLSDATSTDYENSWRELENFLLDNEVLLFFNMREEKEVYKLNSGKDVVFIISELFNIEFYLTDSYTNYLICFNHHDILLGVGTAKKWIDLNFR